MTKKKRKQILQLSGLHIFYIILCLLGTVLDSVLRLLSPLM